MTKPTFDEENILREKGCTLIAGVDEVGRGCFAGPVVAAAVILPQKFPAQGDINDSKLLPPKKREELSVIIKNHALAFSIAEISVPVINQVGIGKAAQMAFRRAIKLLSLKPDFILIDAFYIKAMKKEKQKPIIHGDRLSISIAAASIIAKVYRDDIMRKIHKNYHVYDFFTNKGYGTAKHREAIKKYGLSAMHRTSFDLTKFTI